jgi:hypothetical protein
VSNIFTLTVLIPALLIFSSCSNSSEGISSRTRTEICFRKFARSDAEGKVVVSFEHKVVRSSGSSRLDMARIKYIKSKPSPIEDPQMPENIWFGAWIDDHQYNSVTGPDCSKL